MDINIEDKLSEIDMLRQKLDSFRPFDKELLSYLNTYLDAELTYNSNAIEGSTLSFNDTKFILNDGYIPKGHNVQEILEVINHRDALRYVETLAEKSPYIISEAELLNLHREILKGINNHYAGKYRNDAVYIRTGSGKIQHFPEWQEVPEQVIKLLQWLRDHETHYHPVILASELHYRFVSIHPFIDGNGRTSRLLMNLILLQNGYPMANIKMDNRPAYMEAIEYARENKDMAKFYLVIIEALKEMLELNIETFERRVVWK